MLSSCTLPFSKQERSIGTGKMSIQNEEWRLVSLAQISHMWEWIMPTKETSFCEQKNPRLWAKCKLSVWIFRRSSERSNFFSWRVVDSGLHKNLDLSINSLGQQQLLKILAVLALLNPRGSTYEYVLHGYNCDWYSYLHVTKLVSPLAIWHRKIDSCSPFSSLLFPPKKSPNEYFTSQRRRKLASSGDKSSA